MLYRLILSIIFIFISASCTFLGDDLSELLSRKKLYNRKDAQEQIKTGILANSAACPNHFYSGLFAIESHIPTIIREPYYTTDSVDNCTVLLAALPCGINTGFDLFFFTTSYLAVMNSCDLKPVHP